jgi:hypothetical protein
VVSLSQAAAEVDDASSVLVLRPQSAAGADEEWKRALVDDPEAVDLVGVTFGKGPSTWYDEWCEVLGTDPTAAAVTTPELADDPPDDVEVETVTTPSNLTGIGVKTTPFCTRWDDAVVTIEPLTVLFQYADTEQIYQFLHVLLTRLRTDGGGAQVYADPTVKRERTVELVKSLFDGVVEYDPDGDGQWNAARRSR